VGFIIENVDSMRAEDKETISKTIGVKPIMVDAARFSPVTRARLFWTNYRQPDGHQLQDTDRVGMSEVLEPGWAPLWTMAGGTAHDSFKTFLRPFPAGAPPECRDATFWRFPLNSYDERGLVFKVGADPGDIRKLRDWMAKSVLIPTGDIKSIGSKACEKRLQLAEWIHQHSGEAIVRPLKSFERERALGFPVGSSASQDDQHKEFERCGALGNTFSVLVMKRVAFELARACKGSSPQLQAGGPQVQSAEEALKSLGASSLAPLNPGVPETLFLKVVRVFGVFGVFQKGPSRSFGSLGVFRLLAAAVAAQRQCQWRLRWRLLWVAWRCKDELQGECVPRMWQHRRCPIGQIALFALTSSALTPTAS
jgi:hypothetical protein